MVIEKGEKYKCEACGMVISVEEPCECEVCNVTCCEKAMQKVE